MAYIVCSSKILFPEYHLTSLIKGVDNIRFLCFTLKKSTHIFKIILFLSNYKLKLQCVIFNTKIIVKKKFKKLCEHNNYFKKLLITKNLIFKQNFIDMD